MSENSEVKSPAFCRAKAAEYRELAASAAPDEAAKFRHMAEEWDALAIGFEREAAKKVKH